MNRLRGRGRVLIAVTALAAAVAATSASPAGAAPSDRAGGLERRPFVIDLLNREAGIVDDAITPGANA